MAVLSDNFCLHNIGMFHWDCLPLEECQDASSQWGNNSSGRSGMIFGVCYLNKVVVLRLQTMFRISLCQKSKLFLYYFLEDLAAGLIKISQHWNGRIDRCNCISLNLSIIVLINNGDTT